MNLLDGKRLSEAFLQETKNMVAENKTKNIDTTLAIVVATDDESAQWYVRSIAKKAEQVGIVCRIYQLGPDAKQQALADKLTALATDTSVHGIILQTPLATGINSNTLLDLIPVQKDIDGANPQSIGRLVSDLPAFVPATAAAVLALLSAHKVDLVGKQAVVIGRSRIVGKPVAHLLLDQNATVTICHSHTMDLPSLTRQADIVVVAIGRPGFITRDYLKSGAIVIDVGTNVDKSGNLVGDVDQKSVQDMAGTLSPVPGGVGPVTTALLLKQVVLAATRQ